MSSRLYACLIIASSWCASGCLPADTRPPPAKVLVELDLPGDLRSAGQDSAVIDFETEDGWKVSLDRLFVTMGELEIYGDPSCNSYAEAFYLRVLDLAVPGPQRVGQIWGLNDCLINYSVAKPDEQAVLGAGVTERELTFLRQAVVPVSSPAGPTAAEGMALYVRGTATKAETTVSLDWGFSDRLDFTKCQQSADAAEESRLSLASGETATVTVTLDPRHLFRNATQANTPLMQLIADSDQRLGNANGKVALGELFQAEVPGDAAQRNLAEVLRQTSYPSMFVFAAGAHCNLNDSDD